MDCVCFKNATKTVEVNECCFFIIFITLFFRFPIFLLLKVVYVLTQLNFDTYYILRQLFFSSYQYVVILHSWCVITPNNCRLVKQRVYKR